jgi:hypothetical protein
MAEVYAVVIEGLSGLKSLDDLPADVLKKAQMAVNATTRRGQRDSARAMERQVRFPRGYLTGKNGRLTVSKVAKGKELEGRVRGRDRPTSLARFMIGPVRTGGQGAARAKGVTVEVKPGLAKRMPSAFAIKLKNNNIGLAIRTRNGRAPSMGAKLLSKGLYLMYGPSVDQVFVETRKQVSGDLEEFMEREFLRLLEVNL